MKVNDKEINNLTVVEDNNLVQLSNQGILNLKTLKVLKALIACIDTSSEKNGDIVIKIGKKDLCTMIGSSTKDYTSLKTLVNNLITKVRIADLDDGTERAVALLTSVHWNPKRPDLQVKFNEEITPYLIDLKKNYITYPAENIACFASTYGLILYEFFYSLQKKYRKTEYIVPVQQLRYITGTNNSVSNFYDFEKNVLKRGFNDINNHNLEIIIEGYKKERVGKKVENLIVTVKENQDNPNVKLQKEKEVKKQKAKEQKELFEYHESGGCLLNHFEENILTEIDASFKRRELAKCKKEKPDMYATYSSDGKKTDFEIIMLFLKNDILRFIENNCASLKEDANKALKELGLINFVISSRLLIKQGKELTYDNIKDKYQSRKDKIEKESKKLEECSDEENTKEEGANEAAGEKEILEDPEYYEGCMLTPTQISILEDINSIITCRIVGVEKKNKTSLYMFYSQDGKESDYDVILKMLNNDIFGKIGNNLKATHEAKDAFNKLGLEDFVIATTILMNKNKQISYDNILNESADFKGKRELPF